MSDAPTIEWPGKSGRTYKYWIYPVGTTFNEQAGNYIFAKESSAGRFSPVYIGETDDLGERLGNHEKRPCAIRKGATHIHAHLNGSEQDRLAEESDLIGKWDPPCNG